MAVNDLTFNQLSTVLKTIYSQATGKSAIAVENTADFVSVASVALKTGYDPLATAISQVLSKTIFSVRPYSRKFGGLNVSSQRYGNHVRKLNIIDGDFENDDRFTLANDASVDQYIVKKPEVLQTNFYGANVYQKHVTIYKDQLDCAFSSPDEFGRFISMVLQNASDMIEQAHENTARATVANLIGGKVAKDTGNVIYLLDEYKAETGVTLTTTTVFNSENFVPFAKWLFSYIKTVSQKMTERTYDYHMNVDGKEIARHTPVKNQKLYLYQPWMNNIDSSVISGVFNEKYMKMLDYEGVNFWQAFNNPTEINVKPVAISEKGLISSTSSPVSVKNVFGVLFDEEAAGYTTINQWAQPTPFNARGGYYNQFWHFTDRYWNDFTENCVVFILGTASTT